MKLIPERLLEMTSKQARRKIIELIVSRYGPSETARLLELSKPAVTKYLKGKTHPSDETLRKIFERVEEETRKRVLEVIGEDLLRAVGEFARIAEEEKERRLEAILEEIEEMIYEAKITREKDERY